MGNRGPKRYINHCLAEAIIKLNSAIFKAGRMAQSNAEDALEYDAKMLEIIQHIEATEALMFPGDDYEALMKSALAMENGETN